MAHNLDVVGLVALRTRAQPEAGLGGSTEYYYLYITNPTRRELQWPFELSGCSDGLAGWETTTESH